MPSFHPTHWSHLGYVGKGREVQLRRLDVTRPLVMGISLVHPLTIDSSGAWESQVKGMFIFRESHPKCKQTQKCKRDYSE